MLVTREKPCTRRCRSGHPVPKTKLRPAGVATDSDLKEPHDGEVAPLFLGVTSTNPFGLQRLCGTEAEISATLGPVEDQGQVYVGEWLATVSTQPLAARCTLAFKPSHLMGARPCGRWQVVGMRCFGQHFSLNCWEHFTGFKPCHRAPPTPAKSPAWPSCVGPWPAQPPSKRARTSRSWSKNCSNPASSGLPTSSWRRRAFGPQVQGGSNPELHGFVVHGHPGMDGAQIPILVGFPTAVVQRVVPRLHRHCIGQQA